MRLGFRTQIELPSCITKDYKYLVIDATPPGMVDFINPVIDIQDERKQKCQQKRKEVISGLDRLIGQLTGILEYYNMQEREKVEEDIDRFIKKNHLAYISHPTYQPTLWDDSMTMHTELKRKHRDAEVMDFVRVN
jgi:hypothetical protein